VIDCDKIIIEHTPDAAKLVVPVLLMHGNVRCVIPVDGIPTLFDSWESVCARQKRNTSRQHLMQVAHEPLRTLAYEHAIIAAMKRKSREYPRNISQELDQF
jgi:hypothetical protein